MNKIKRVAFDSNAKREVGLILCDQCIKLLRSGDAIIRLLTYESITIEDSVPCQNCRKEVNSLPGEKYVRTFEI